MGAYDTVKEVLSGRWGGVRQGRHAPGYAAGFGSVGAGPDPGLHLAGQPGRALVSFHVFVAAGAARLAGLDPLADLAFEAVAAVDWPSIKGRANGVRVVVGADGRGPAGGQGSHHARRDGRRRCAGAGHPADVEQVDGRPGADCLPLLGTMGA